MSAKYQMFYPGVYAPEEQAALDSFCSKLPIDMWGRLVKDGELSAKEILADDLTYYANGNFEKLRIYGAKKMRMGMGPPQEAPESRKDGKLPIGGQQGAPADYGKSSKYGSYIAAPFFGEEWTVYPQMFLKELGNEWIHCKDYGEAEFFLPIRSGDVLTVKLEAQTIEDITPKEGATLRVFNVTGTESVYNQDGKLVWTETVTARNGYRRDMERLDGKLTTVLFLPNGNEKWNTTCGAYVNRRTFTKQDWDRIVELDAAEYVRGSDAFTFEDAKEGDELGKVITPAVTLVDIMSHSGQYFKAAPRKREIYLEAGGIENLYGITKDSNGCPYFLFEYNLVDHIDGYYLGDIPDTYLRNLIVRLIMNYVGDVGWLSKIKWYTQNSHLGAPDDGCKSFTELVPELRGKSFDFVPTYFDSYTARGKVIKKYKDDGACKLDIVCWAESFDGGLCLPAYATVILPDKQREG